MSWGAVSGLKRACCHFPLTQLLLELLRNYLTQLPAPLTAEEADAALRHVTDRVAVLFYRGKITYVLATTVTSAVGGSPNFVDPCVSG